MGLFSDPTTALPLVLITAVVIVGTVLAIVYVLSPIDLIPDTIPLLGWLDDGLLAYVLLQLAFKLLPAELHAALRAKVDARATR